MAREPFGLPWMRLGDQESRMREKAGDQRSARRRLKKTKSARSAARTATAAIPPAMPPIWAWVRLEAVDWVVAGAVVDVTGAGATVVLVELEVGVGVTMLDDDEEV